MKFGGSYAGWLTHTVWRKKSTLVIAAVLIVMCVISLKFYRYELLSNNADVIYVGKIDDSVQEKRTLLGGSSVQFVINTASVSPDLSIPEETPSRDDYKNNEKKSFDYMQPFNNGNGVTTNRNIYIPNKRLFHLDLKGAPPKVSYLQKIIPLVRSMGATGVLIEWEDMFPWSGAIANLAAKNAYSRKDVETIIETCKSNGLEIIPLVQTFGHVEFALKQKEYVHLREVPESAQALCPSLNASMDFVAMMIEQIMEIHNDVKYLHIGCDEVFQIGECIRCRTQQRDNLYLGHVVRVASFVKTKYPLVTPIIWDDMLRHLSSSSMEQYQIGSLVQPMVWVYAEDVYRFVQYSVWEKYAAIFPKVWAASAFKGAFGETLYVPNVKRHLENNIRWLEVMSNEAPKFSGGFEGIALTGWQRYDHFSVLCELLPAAIPSLTVTLLALSHGYMNASLRVKVNNHLSCGVFGPQTYFNLNVDPFLWDSYLRCPFPGHMFYRLTARLNSAEKETDELIQSISKAKGWMTDYNVRHNFSTPLRIDELMQEHPRIYHTITTLARNVKEALVDVFDDFTISEWIEQNIYPYILSLEKIQKDSVALRARKIWPRRPFQPLKDLYRFGLNSNDDN